MPTHRAASGCRSGTLRHHQVRHRARPDEQQDRRDQHDYPAGNQSEALLGIGQALDRHERTGQGSDRRRKSKQAAQQSLLAVWHQVAGPG